MRMIAICVITMRSSVLEPRALVTLALTHSEKEKKKRRTDRPEKERPEKRRAEKKILQFRFVANLSPLSW